MTSSAPLIDDVISAPRIDDVIRTQSPAVMLRSSHVWPAALSFSRYGWPAGLRGMCGKKCEPPIWGSRSKAHKRQLPLLHLTAELSEDQEAVVAPLRAQVKAQGDVVRDLKATGSSELQIKNAVTELKARKKLLQDKLEQLSPAKSFFDRAKMEDLVKRRFVYDQSFAIYGGLAGQFDLGPVGCALKANLLAAWRTYFVLEEQMLEVECSTLTPRSVLLTSGHVDKFTDLMVKDSVSGECFRLDHLIKAHAEQVVNDPKSTEAQRGRISEIMHSLDGMSRDQMRAVMAELQLTAPKSGNPLTEPVAFNLMFETSIGPSGSTSGYLRPETAQGVFVNFKRLLEFNQGKLPLVVAQIGNAFRNEICPRSGMMRMREFTLAEIEHFCHPDQKNDHAKFQRVGGVKCFLYSANCQMDGRSGEVISIAEAVARGVIANQTLAYYMARIQQFLLHIGADSARVRFRQHLPSEMAHYACDCWDAELLTSDGWIECVGCADRSAYDLTQHANATGVRLSVEWPLPEPKTIQVHELAPVSRRCMMNTFKKDAPSVLSALAGLSPDQVEQCEAQLRELGQFRLRVPFSTEPVIITKDMVSVRRYQKSVQVEEVVPHVIEPSFGLTRIMQAILEHTFRIRPEDERRTFWALPPHMAPYKCVVLPITSHASLKGLVHKMSRLLIDQGVTHQVDDSSGSLGRRYARADQVAVPFAICIDFDSLSSPESATIRERDTMQQLRLPLTDVPRVVKSLASQECLWSDLSTHYPCVRGDPEKGHVGH